MTFQTSQRIKQWLRKFGVDIAHAPNWNCIFECTEFIVDVGAHYGETYEHFRAMGYGKPIISYEPCAETFKKLLKIRGTNWVKRRIALSDHNGEADFHSYEYDTSNSLNTSQMHKVSQVEKVPVRRLDEEDLIPGPFFLKIDAEGEDLKVFDGAKGLYSRIPFVMLEVPTASRFLNEPTMVNVITHLQNSGYEVLFADRQHPFVHLDRPTAFDFVFRRTSV